MKQQIIEKLRNIVKELTNEARLSSPEGEADGGQDIKIELTIPKDDSHGDYSSNIALRLAKILGKNPLEIAQEIVEEILKQVQDDGLKGIEKVEAVAPGFINFYLSKEALIENAQHVIDAPENVGKTDSYKGKKVIVEFTDPNPFKEFHIGHVYTNTVGESLSRLYESIGATVQRADYFGDVGMHVAKALWGLQKMFEEDGLDMDKLAEKPLEERINYFGKAYAKGSSAYEEQPETQDEMKKLNRLVYIAAQKMWEKEKGLTPQVDYRQDAEIDESELQTVYDLYTVGRKWSLAYFDSIYDRLGMKFAEYYPESIAGEKGYTLVKEHIADGIFKEDGGAIIFPGDDHGLHTRVFINSLGLPTYEAKELGLAVWKAEEFPYDFSIILTGNEINEYFKVLMKALSLIIPELAEKSKHIGHGMVKLASGKKMSSRTGQIISGKEVLDEAKSLSKEKIAEAKIGHESVDDGFADDIAEQVGIGAIKYSFLKSGIGKDIPFSFEDSVSFEGNAGPYVQYTYTRTQSVLAKASAEQNTVIASEAKQSNSESQQRDSGSLRLNSGQAKSEMTNITDSMHYPSDYTPSEDELRILRYVQKFSETVENAATTYSPNVVTEYLFELCQLFNNFYQKYRILNATTDEEKEFRLALTATVGIVLKQGLYLLGIVAPERM